MKHRIAVVAALVILVGIGVLWLKNPHGGSENLPTVPPLASTSPAGTLAQPAPTQAAASDKPASPRVTSTSPALVNQPSAGVAPAQASVVSKALDELKSMYGEAGSLNWDEAKALIARREKATEELVGRLSRLGRGGARALEAGYAQADTTRARLLLVQALGGLDDPEAAGVLQALLASADSFSVRKEMVLALGQRQDAAAEQALTTLLAAAEDVQLRMACAKSLAGRASALPTMAARIGSETSAEVRMELIHSVGLIRNAEAMNVLTSLSEGAKEVSVRKTAIQELGRSFSEAARPTLEKLLNDPDETIRRSAVTSLTRVKTDTPQP